MRRPASCRHAGRAAALAIPRRWHRTLRQYRRFPRESRCHPSTSPDSDVEPRPPGAHVPRAFGPAGRSGDSIPRAGLASARPPRLPPSSPTGCRPQSPLVAMKAQARCLGWACPCESGRPGSAGEGRVHADPAAAAALAHAASHPNRTSGRDACARGPHALQGPWTCGRSGRWGET